MAGFSRSNKVSRVAGTGGSGRRRGESSLGFYALLVVIALIGIGVVAYSRQERLAVTTPNNVPPLEAVNNTGGESAGSDASQNREGDYWYEAYGIYVCDKFVAPIDSSRNPYGLATANDGIIYIHPAAKQYAGEKATLGLFADGVQLPLTRNSIKVPGDNTDYKTGAAKCGDQDAELVVKEWSDPAKPDEGRVLRSNPRDIRVKNGAAVTIAFVPKGKTDIPLPESATNGALQAAPGKDPNKQSAAPATDAGAPAASDANPAAGTPATGAPAAPTTAAP